MTTQNVNNSDSHSRTVNQESVAHLAGVFDAAGGITVRITANDEYSVGYSFKPLVHFSQPKYRNDAIFGKLFEYCEENFVQYGMTTETSSDDRRTFQIKKNQSIKNFLQPMMPHLVIEYENAVTMILKIIPRMDSDLHTEKEGLYELMEFADIVRQKTKRQTSGLKYDQQFFKEKWSISE